MRRPSIRAAIPARSRRPATRCYILGPLPGNSEPITIDNGSTLALNTADANTIAFAGATGTLILPNPANFNGDISGITPQDVNQVLDLGGFNSHPGDVFETSTALNGANTLLTVTDKTTNSAPEFVTLLGTSANNVSWTATSDGYGGANVVDPPVTDSATSVLSSATADSAGGTVAFANSNPTDTFSANFTPDSSNYLGSFSLNPATASNGNLSVNYEFDFSNDQIKLAPGETLTQSYSVSIADAQNPSATQSQTVSVSIGGPGNDNFVFQPGIGADTITNFKPQQDTIELDHFVNAQTVQELQSLITQDVHGDAVINLDHNDSITVSGVTAAQMQQVIQAGHVLLH